MRNRKQAPLGWTTQDLPATGQPTPTTSTVGYLGQVMFDTDGNEWKCIKVDGSVYAWEKQLKHLVITQTNYNALVTKDTNTIYVIVG